MAQTMTRHEMWRHAYRQRRYLEHANDKELRQRLSDVMDNMSDFDEDGKIAIKNPLIEGEWIERFTHLLEEFAIRGEAISPETLREGHFDLRRYVSLKKSHRSMEREGVAARLLPPQIQQAEISSPTPECRQSEGPSRQLLSRPVAKFFYPRL